MLGNSIRWSCHLRFQQLSNYTLLLAINQCSSPQYWCQESKKKKATDLLTGRNKNAMCKDCSCDELKRKCLILMFLNHGASNSLKYVLSGIKKFWPAKFIKTTKIVADGVAQVVELLLSKHGDLSSNSPAKKSKNKITFYTASFLSALVTNH
jgi:hypothetical protein